ncbi:MAG: hypothetical protein RL885_18965 [Planctomycetota bacterium]
MRLFKALLSVAAVALAFGPVAQAKDRNPGSVLIYPIYDSQPGSGTVVSITNVKNDPTFNANQNLNGVVDVHFIYIDGDYWTEFNRFERLTPNDTFTAVANWHNPNSEIGFLYVIALDPNTQEPVSHNHLIGDEIVADGSGNWLYGFDAIAFKSLAAEGQAADLNANGNVDLDGVEYEGVADQMMLSSFIGSNNSQVVPMLILVSLVGDDNFETRLDFELYNNNEYEFSATYFFRCFVAVELADIDESFTDDFLANTNIDTRDNGLVIGTTGWARIDGDVAVDVVGNQAKRMDPPFVGAMAQSLSGYSAGHLLHETDAKNATGGVLDTLQ